MSDPRDHVRRELKFDGFIELGGRKMRFDLAKNPECHDMLLVVRLAFYTKKKYKKCPLEVADLVQIGWGVLKRCYDKYRDIFHTLKYSRTIFKAIRRAYWLEFLASAMIPVGKSVRHRVCTTTPVAGLCTRRLKTLARAIAALRRERRSLKVVRETIDFTAEKAAEAEAIEAVLDARRFVDEHEDKVLQMHYGLDGHEEMTLAEIGNSRVFGKVLSRQRVRQIERDAIRKIRLRVVD